MRHAISWFELAVTDLDRAISFSTAVLGTDLGEVTSADDRRFAMFSSDPRGSSERACRT
jgi:predicted enzyme related to lactoylglutathione lyase